MVSYEKIGNHTIKKFELVSEYAKGWAHKILGYNESAGVVYIDCMCNCGKYYDNEGNIVEGTAIKEYAVPENGNRKVAYVEKKELLDGIVKKYRSDWLMDDDIPPNAMPVGGEALTESEKNISKREGLNKAKSKRTGGSGLRTTPRNVPIEHHRAAIEDIGEVSEVEVERSGQT